MPVPFLRCKVHVSCVWRKLFHVKLQFQTAACVICKPFWHNFPVYRLIHAGLSSTGTEKLEKQAETTIWSLLFLGLKKNNPFSNFLEALWAQKLELFFTRRQIFNFSQFKKYVNALPYLHLPRLKILALERKPFLFTVRTKHDSSFFAVIL